MSILSKIKYSSKELSNVTTICICAMMLALRIVLGMFTNFTLAFLPFVKVGFSFIPIVITAYLYGPIPAAIVSALGDVLSIILSNPSGFSIIPGITVCCFVEGFIYGLFLYKSSGDVKTLIISKVFVLVLCLLPLNTLFLYIIMGIPYFQMLLYRVIILVPFSVIEIIIDYFMIKLTNKIVKQNVKQ